MAKKLKTWQIVVGAMAVIIGFGSIASLVRGREKEEEKTKKADILLTDLEVGTDLSGYALRLTGSDNDFLENNVECRPAGHYYMINLWFQIEFENSNYLTFENESIAVGGGNVDDGSYFYEKALEVPSCGDVEECVATVKLSDFVFGENSIVSDLKRGAQSTEKFENHEEDIYSAFKFVYVGTASPASTVGVSYSLRETQEEVDFFEGKNVSTIVDEDEWSPLY